MELNTDRSQFERGVLTLRSVQSSDAPALNALIESLSRLEKQWRFHGAVNGVSEHTLRRLTSVDYARHVAYVVHAHGAHGVTLIADGRFAVDESTGQAEAAMIVAPGWRRRGVGRLLLGALTRAALHAGMNSLHGAVVVENTPMQHLLRQSGFQRVSRPHAAGAILYEAALVASQMNCANTRDRRVSHAVPAWIPRPWTVRQSPRGLEI
jgi:GNAT superfamily N-acetyltransferase